MKEKKHRFFSSHRQAIVLPGLSRRSLRQHPLNSYNVKEMYVLSLLTHRNEVFVKEDLQFSKLVSLYKRYQ